MRLPLIRCTDPQGARTSMFSQRSGGSKPNVIPTLTNFLRALAQMLCMKISLVFLAANSGIKSTTSEGIGLSVQKR